jgi:hypothetical protein
VVAQLVPSLLLLAHQAAALEACFRSRGAAVSVLTVSVERVTLLLAKALVAVISG